ncbi:MAG: SMC-Scp complex subunit ScpB [Pseudomonadota bacterium]
MEENKLDKILEALLLASDQPLSVEQMHRLLSTDLSASKADIREALERLATSYESRPAQLKEVGSGFRLQIRSEYSDWVGRLWQEKPPKYSRALLETLALICYRQPITRGEIEEIRGVSMSPNIIKTLLERGWVREIGVREVPGRPALLGTTPQFLDDFSLKSLDELPSLPEIKDPEQLEAALLRLGQTAITADAAPAQAQAPDAPDSSTATVH